MKTKSIKQALKSYAIIGNDLVDQGVIWDVADGKFQCGFMGAGRQYMGAVETLVPDFPDGIYGVTNSREWVKILDLMGDEFEITLEPSHHDYCPQVKLEGNGYTSDIRLAMPSVIEDNRKVYKYATSKKYPTNGLLSTEFTDKFVKSTNALKTDKDTGNVTFTVKGDNLTVSIGTYTTLSFVHKLKEDPERVDGTIKVPMGPLMDMIKINEKADHIQFGIEQKALMLTFCHSKEELTVRYYLVRNI